MVTANPREVITRTQPLLAIYLHGLGCGARWTVSREHWTRYNPAFGGDSVGGCGFLPAEVFLWGQGTFCSHSVSEAHLPDLRLPV